MECKESERRRTAEEKYVLANFSSVSYRAEKESVERVREEPQGETVPGGAGLGLVVLRVVDTISTWSPILKLIEYMFSTGIFPLLSKDGCSRRNNSTNSLIKIKHPRLSHRKPIYTQERVQIVHLLILLCTYGEVEF
ncbi:hypothetical protein RUM43_001718 [Polyplax serrata]|uniref:Uncharacterized protein n=1 Tax=Polyplax serrata TaxID=468196 RepID=A0AAN8SGM7_POLSC